MMDNNLADRIRDALDEPLPCSRPSPISELRRIAKYQRDLLREALPDVEAIDEIVRSETLVNYLCRANIAAREASHESD